MTKSFRNHLKAVFRIPSFKIEKVSLKKTEAKTKQQRRGCNGAFSSVSCPDLSEPRSYEQSAKKENKLQTRSAMILPKKHKNAAYHNIQQMLSHFLCPYTPLPPTPAVCNSASVTNMADMDTASLRLQDIFSAFSCPQCPPGGLPCDTPCKCNQCSDGCYQVTFDTPRPCNGPVCPGSNSGMAQPNPNCFPTCPYCGGYCKFGGQCGCSSCRRWGPCGPCGLCCCCAAPSSNTNSGQTFYAPCSPEALRNPSQACIGTVLCSSAAPVDFCNSGSTTTNSDHSYGCYCSCGCCHPGWDNYQSAYQPSDQYGQSHCHCCCCCAAQLAATPDHTEPYFNNCEASDRGNSYNNSQYHYDPSWYNNDCGYQNPWASSCQYSSPYQYANYANYANYAFNAAASEEPNVTCVEAPVCDTQLAEKPDESASPQDSAKQPPEPPRCIKNISSPAPDAATVCFCPDCTKKSAPSVENRNIISSSPENATQKPLPPPRWHGINPTLAKSYPFNSTTRKYHQHTSPVNMAKAAFSSTTPQTINSLGVDPQTKEESDEVEMPQVWSFPESYKRFFNRMSTAKTINLRSSDRDKWNEKTRP